MPNMRKIIIRVKVQILGMQKMKTQNKNKEII